MVRESRRNRSSSAVSALALNQVLGQHSTYVENNNADDNTPMMHDNIPRNKSRSVVEYSDIGGGRRGDAAQFSKLRREKWIGEWRGRQVMVNQSLGQDYKMLAEVKVISYSSFSFFLSCSSFSFFLSYFSFSFS